MFLYNVTAIVEESAQANWLNWATGSLIPGIMALELFTSNRVLRVVDSPNEGVTYCLQFFAESKADIDRYFALSNMNAAQRYSGEFGQQALSFTTVMEYVV